METIKKQKQPYIFGFDCSDNVLDEGGSRSLSFSLKVGAGQPRELLEIQTKCHYIGPLLMMNLFYVNYLFCGIHLTSKSRNVLVQE